MDIETYTHVSRRNKALEPQIHHLFGELKLSSKCVGYRPLFEGVKYAYLHDDAAIKDIKLYVQRMMRRRYKKIVPNINYILRRSCFLNQPLAIQVYGKNRKLCVTYGRIARYLKSLQRLENIGSGYEMKWKWTCPACQCSTLFIYSKPPEQCPDCSAPFHLDL